jgi:hypothetical protein
VPDFDPQKVLIDWKESHGFTIADAQAGVSVMGATGSGKTSGPGALLARAYLKNGFGGLVLCAKPEFSRLFKQNATIPIPEHAQIRRQPYSHHRCAKPDQPSA